MTGAVGFLWGFAEATFFFIVPDVWLTWLVLSVREEKKVWAALGWTLAGALAGGLVSYAAGRWLPYNQLVGWLDRVPGISPALIREVAGGIDQGGVANIFAGIVRGIPYKIYAVQWGAQSGSWLVWGAVSLVARGGRFFISMAATRMIHLAGGRFIPGWEDRKAAVFIVFWATFYIFYYLHYPG